MPIDLTTVGTQVSREQEKELYAAYADISSAYVSPELNKQWTREEIGYEFRSLQRQIDNLKREGKLQ